MASYLSAHADITDPRFTGHVWRDADGTVNATVDIALKTAAHSIWLCFDDPAQARALAAACAAAAEAIETFGAGQEAPDAG